MSDPASRSSIRDMALLDAVDALPRQPFRGAVWRVAGEGRDPTIGGMSNSRWCNGTFEVLYTSLQRDGALAEVHALLAMQPVFPSKPRWFLHELTCRTDRTLHLADLAALASLGVDPARYVERDYRTTQAIADAAFFLDFDGLIVPSARWPCQNAVLFTERVGPGNIAAAGSTAEPIDWKNWRQGQRTRSAESGA